MQFKDIKKEFDEISQVIEKNIWKRWFFIVLATFFILIIMLAGAIFVYQGVHAHKIYQGAYVGDVNLGGYTTGEARDLLLRLTDKLNKEGILFIAQTKDGYKEVRLTSLLIAPEDPDLVLEIIGFDLEKTLTDAWQLGRGEGWFDRTIEQLLLLFTPKRAEPHYFIHSGEVKRILIQNFSALEQPAKDARLEIKDHRVVVVPEIYGNSFDYDEALLELRRRLVIFNFEGPIELTLKIDYPKIRAGDTLLAVAKAENILEKFKENPLILKYQDKNWEVEGEDIESWLEFILKSEDEIAIGLNQALATSFLEEIAKEIDIKAKDALFAMATSSEEELRVMKFQASEDGLKLDVEASYKKIVKTLENQGSNEVELIVNVVKPRQTTERVNTLGIKELIGVGESNFAGSPKNRRYNIGVGAEKLNGLLIAPNEEFSLVQALGEVNAAAGYLPELVIKGHETIPEYGGGLCQIGTTTFRAALYSGLPITERRPHSYRVSYYEPAGMDATIYNPRPDLKFINDTGNYILFTTEIDGDNLRFKFYGTKDGRKIEIENPPRIFNITYPGPTKIIETLDLKPSEKKCTERAHNGADTEFVRKITYSNGEVKEEVWKSHYKAWQAVCLLGVEELSTATSTEVIAE